MKKILTTVAGIIAISFMGSACGPAVDTQEATSTTPITTSTVPAQRVENTRQQVQEFKKSRDAVRPTATPRPSTHEIHVSHVVKVKPRVMKTKLNKVIKPKVKTVKKVIHKKTVKVKKSVKKIYHKIKKVSLSGIAACIAKYESGGNPRAQNPSSTASGLFQFVNGTWNHFGGYARAMYAPISVQLQKFYIVWDGGRGAGNWVTAYKCT